MKTGTDTVDPDHNLILTDIEAQIIMTHTEAIQGHTTGIIKDITGVVHNAHTPPLTHIDLAMTLIIIDHLHIEALLLTPGITVDHTLNQPTNLPGKIPTDPLHIPADHEVEHVSKGTQ